MFDKFTDRARKAVLLAKERAVRFNHKSIDKDHILLVLVDDESGIASVILEKLGVSLENLKINLRDSIKTFEQGTDISRDIPFAENTKRSFENSLEESRSLNHNYIGTEHLMLGCLRETSMGSYPALADLGLTVEVVRKEIAKLIGNATSGKENILRRLEFVEKEIGEIKQWISDHKI